MPRVIHFEIGVDDPERANKFYSAVFGWDIQRWVGPRESWVIKTGSEDQPGIDGGIFKRPGPANIMHNIGVDSVDDFLIKVAQNGGKVIVPKMALPGIGYLAYCQDTEGNTFGILQEDKSVFLVCEVPPHDQ